MIQRLKEMEETESEESSGEDDAPDWKNEMRRYKERLDKHPLFGEKRALVKADDEDKKFEKSFKTQCDALRNSISMKKRGRVGKELSKVNLRYEKAKQAIMLRI